MSPDKKKDINRLECIQKRNLRVETENLPCVIVMRDKTWSEDGFKNSLPNPFRDVITEMEPDLSQLCGGRKRNNCYKLSQETFMLDTRGNFFTSRTAQQWVRLPKEAAVLELFNIPWDKALSNQV